MASQEKKERDFFGCEALYCSEGVYSRELKGFGKRELNWGFLGEYLSGHVISTTETIYSGVERVACPGQDFKPARVLDCSREEARELLGKALSSSIKKMAEGAACSSMQLSGGIDSSSVYALSKTLGVELRPITMEFKNRAACEREFIAGWSEEISRVEMVPWSLEKLRAKIRAHHDLPTIPNGVFTAGIREATGPGALFTGYGGDELFSSFQAEKPGRRAFSFGSSLVPGFFKPGLKALGIGPKWLPSYFTKKFESDTGILDRMSASKLTRAKSRREQVLSFLFGPSAMMFREMEHRDARADGVQLKSPFLDQELLELVLSLDDEYFRGGLPKQLLRDLPGNGLPGIIAKRSGKADFTEVSAEVVLNIGTVGYFEEIPLYDLGWCKRGAVLKAREVLEKKGKGWQGLVWSLWALIGVSEVMREVEGC